ncbi:MAG: histidine kinase [Saprospiraceae bacterium]|nr:histidine kinase [Saprospiraceae bacterium]
MYRILILLLCFGSPLGAQTPMFRLQQGHELGNAKMTTVMQDSRGWIWCGAQNGLFRYDGLHFQRIQLADTFRQAAVSALYEWNGMIWAGFSNGAIGRIPTTGNFIPALTGDAEAEKKFAPSLSLWQIEEGLPQQEISAITADPSGALWMATYGEGLYVWKNNRLYQFGLEDGMSSLDLYALACDTQGRIWAATDAGINLCQISVNGQKQVQHLGSENGLPDEIITCLSTDPQGNIWIGTQEMGIARMDAQTLRPVFTTPNWAYGEISTLTVFGSKEAWVGTTRDGLIRVDLHHQGAMPLPDNHPLRHTKTHALWKDREGLLWSVMDKGQLYVAEVRFGIWQPGVSAVQTLLSDRQRRCWAGCQDGLYLQDKPSGPFRKVLADNVISLWESASGEVWAGTFGNGVAVLDDQGRVRRQLNERNGLINGSVLNIGGRGTEVWLATLGGVMAIGAEGKGEVQVQTALGTSYVYKVLTDRQGRVWFGTDGKGLAVLENGVLRFITEINGTVIKTVYSIVEAPDGQIWFSTDREGLFSFNNTDYQHFTIENGLHSQQITGLAVDGNGLVHIAYEDGFDLLNPRRKNHVMFCAAAAGGINLNALCTDATGNVWMGMPNGIIRSAAYDEPFLDDPQPGITAVSVLLKSVDFQQQNRFPYNENYIIFNFSGLWFTNPDVVSYRYKLEGFDPDWKVSKDHLASYPNLPPGKYTFRVQTSEHGHFEEVPEASWSFFIEHPFWQQWWFVLLCLLAGISLLWWTIHNRETRLQKEAGLKRERVQAQFETLKSQINPHFLFNSFNTLITIIEENPKTAVQYVEHLSDFYRNIMAYRERDFISLKEEMLLVKDFCFLLEKRYETGFKLQVNLGDTKGQIMPLSLQLLVENAVKHNIISASKPLVVEILSEQDGYITVRNNLQRKIKAEPSTHFGLQSLIHRYELIGAKPVIVAETSAYFMVKVPV